MRVESSVTALSWIPSEAISGITKLSFEQGLTHYDSPPPDVLEDLDGLQRADRFRFANQLRAWVEVRDGRIVGHGQSGGGRMGSSTIRVGAKRVAFAATAFPDLRPPPEVNETSARFVQTAGGRAGLPAPRHVRRKPYVQLAAPLAWTTLALTLRADGTSSFAVHGASPFPRHWIYDQQGELVAKTGMIDFKAWYRRAFRSHSPWGDEHSPTLVTVAETALERKLSATIMRAGTKPEIRRVPAGRTLVEQGDVGGDLYLLLDGVLVVEVNGERIAELGPGAVVGERAVLEGGRRTCTLRAATPVKMAVAPTNQLDRHSLASLASGHHREELDSR